jgi:putative peptidoglycan lipid II flippase
VNQYSDLVPIQQKPSMNSKSLRQISSLSLSTAISRVLGLIRDALFFSSLGTGVLASAFLVAFTLPNLFRRLLGEGALSSAFIPLFTKAWSITAQDGFRLLNQTLSRMLIYFGGGIICLIALLMLLQRSVYLGDKWEATVPLLALLLPYAVLICLAAILTAALNVLHKFFIASLSPILLNVAMILALAAGVALWGTGTLSLVWALCAGVLIGGCLQLMLPMTQLLRCGWRPSFDWTHSQELARLRMLFFTATGGAAMLQINLLVTRLIAYQHSDEAVSQLYLASRLTELPLGVFAVAIYTVLFPLLSHHAAAGDRVAFSETHQRGILLTLGITLPAAAGLALLAHPVIALLFQRGAFVAADVDACAPVLAIYAFSIPVFALVALLTRVFHAQQEMATPVRIAGLTLVVNVVFSITLMIPFGVKGLAAATLLSATVQWIALMVGLQRQQWLQPTPFKAQLSPIARMLVATAFMALCVHGIRTVLPLAADASLLLRGAHTGLLLAAGIGSYGLAVILLRLQHCFHRPSKAPVEAQGI